MSWSKKNEEDILGKDWRRNNPQEQVRCTGCFREFWRDTRETWKCHCDSCWHHSPHAKRETRDKLTALLAERDSVTTGLADLQRERQELQREREDMQQEMDELGRENRVLSSMLLADLDAPNRAEIPPNMLDRLIRLAHPDRHGNSDSATQATAWLLSQRA